MRLSWISLIVLAVFPTIAQESCKIETVAGTGKKGAGLDGRFATESALDQPFHCDLDPSGNLYIVDTGNHRIRKIDRRSGLIVTVAGTGKKGYSGDAGSARDATLNEPYAAVIDSKTGDLYIVDRLNSAIRVVDGKSGIISTLEVDDSKGYTVKKPLPAKPVFREPNDCFLDGKGGLLVADVADWRVRRVDLRTGKIDSFAGIGRVAGKIDRTKIGDGGPASESVIVGARAVCVDGYGNTYICEREGNAIRKVDNRGMISAFAGTGAKGYSGDGGDALVATFNGPKGIRCDRRGNVYVVDTENHAIRRIDIKTGLIATVAGGSKGSTGDGGPASKAALDRPHGCIVDDDGNLFIADTENHRVRKVAAP